MEPTQPIRVSPLQLRILMILHRYLPHPQVSLWRRIQLSIGIVIATDVDSNSITYSLSGADASALSIGPSSGVLVFNTAPDYETKSSYSVVVTASDGTNSGSEYRHYDFRCE